MPKGDGLKGTNRRKRGKRFKLGYDIYIIGGGNVPERARCILRRNKIPISVDDEAFKEMLPDEIIYPNADHALIEAMLEAMFQGRLSYLISLKQGHPHHPFGFEDFLTWSERRAGRTRSTLDQGGDWLVLPSAKPLSRKLFREASVGTLALNIYILRFEKDDAALEIILSQGKTTYSRLYFDPDSGLYKMMEHYPHLYLLSDEDPHLPWELFELPLKGLDPRKRIGFHDPKDLVESTDAETSTSHQ